MPAELSTPVATTAKVEYQQSLGLAMARFRLVSAAGLGLFVLLSLLSNDDGPVLCPYRRCTGGYCPGCGLTRAGGHLLRGQVATSWAQHPYAILLAAQIPVLGISWLVGSARLRSTISAATMKILAVNTVAVVGIWVYRLAVGEIPLPFAS